MIPIQKVSFFLKFVKNFESKICVFKSFERRQILVLPSREGFFCTLILFLDFNFWSEDAAEDAAELKKVEEMDAVNEESTEALAEGLAEKLQRKRKSLTKNKRRRKYKLRLTKIMRKRQRN